MQKGPIDDAAFALPADDLPEQNASVEAVGQAEDLLLVALNVFELGKYGIARSLAILGLEESAKAFAYRLVALRAGWFKGSPPVETNLEGAQELAVTERDLNRLHPEKHALDAGLEAMLNLLEGIAPLVASARAGGDVEAGLVDGYAERAAQRLIAGIETAENLNTWKNEGFYVGRSGSKIWTPRSVTADEAAAVITRLEKRLAFVGPMVRFRNDPADLEAMALAMFGGRLDSMPPESPRGTD